MVKSGYSFINAWPQFYGIGFFSLDGGGMKRVNAYQFYQFGMSLHPLTQVKEGQKLKDIFLALMTAKNWLVFFLNDQVVDLSICKSSGRKIYRTIAELVPDDPPLSPADLDKELDWSHYYDLTTGIKEFETVLSAELQSISTYHVSQKAAYSTTTLIEHAELVLTESVRVIVPPQTIQDIQQAGRCLAFECPTAAGFHILRATEAAIRSYYAAIVGKPPKMKMRNWGTYIKILKGCGADTKVISVIDQIREIHRNPIMHPETVLEMDEAIMLLGVANSAMIAMVADMQKRKAEAIRVTDPLIQNSPV